jgi:hypothetical protein
MIEIEALRRCFVLDRVRYSDHALEEMRVEEYGRIYDEDVSDALMHGEIIEHYPDSFPLPSCLVYGSTAAGRPIHTVLAYSSEFDRITLITVYQPDPKLWIAYKTRRNK